MGFLNGLFGKEKNGNAAPEMKDRGEAFWKKAEIFTLTNAGFDQLESRIQAEGIHFVTMGAKVRFNPGSEQISFSKPGCWTAELVKVQEDGGVYRWKAAFRDYDEKRLKRADILDMNMLLTKFENIVKDIDPNVEIRPEEET